MRITKEGRRKAGCYTFAAATSTALLVLCLGAQAADSGPITDPVEALDEGIHLYDAHRYQNSEDALVKLVRSTTFRRLDAAQKSMVYSHIAYSKIDQGEELGSLVYIDIALKQAKREYGESSLTYVGLLRTKAIAYYYGDKQREAVRVARDMEDRIERMDSDDYSDELNYVKRMLSKLYREKDKEEKLPTDLSDFYTQCETVNSSMSMQQADSVMQKYSLVGKEYKPSYKRAAYFKNTHLTRARESSQDRRTRSVYIPDEDHLEDWCVVYKDGKMVDRALVSAKDDR